LEWRTPISSFAIAEELTLRGVYCQEDEQELKDRENIYFLRIKDICGLTRCRLLDVGGGRGGAENGEGEMKI
jgi:hypothetical protein